jgi:RNA polymerase sigma factor (sigma-70 family)
VRRSEGGTRDQKFAPRRLDRDRRLVEALRLAERTATEDLVASYGGRAYRLAIGITGNKPDAKEVVQDALWTVVQNIDTFRGDSPFGPWLDRIVANAAYDKLRGRRRRLGDCSLDEVAAIVDEHGESIVDSSKRAQDPAVATDLRIVLMAAIEALPEDDRTVVMLRDVEGLPTRKIAQIAGSSVASVKTRPHRARLDIGRQRAAPRGVAESGRRLARLALYQPLRRRGQWQGPRRADQSAWHRDRPTRLQADISRPRTFLSRPRLYL